MSRDVVFVEGMRTAFGRLGGGLKDFSGGTCNIVLRASSTTNLREGDLFLPGGVSCFMPSTQPAGWC